VRAGFSGHGMMHGLAAGRAIAERVICGGDRSTDLCQMGDWGGMDERPYEEWGIL